MPTSCPNPSVMVTGMHEKLIPMKPGALLGRQAAPGMPNGAAPVRDDL